MLPCSPIFCDSAQGNGGPVVLQAPTPTLGKDAGDLSRSKRTKLALDWPLALLRSGFCPMLYDRGNLVPWWPLPKLQASVKRRDQPPDCQTHSPL